MNGGRYTPSRCVAFFKGIREQWRDFHGMSNLDKYRMRACDQSLAESFEHAVRLRTTFLRYVDTI